MDNYGEDNRTLVEIIEDERLKKASEQQVLESYVWDPYHESAPTDQLAFITKECFDTIKRQPFYRSKNMNKQYDPDRSGDMFIKIKHAEAAKMQEEGARAPGPFPDPNWPTTGIAAQCQKEPRPEAFVIRKCENCEYDAQRIESKSILTGYPAACTRCSLNQHFIDNFKLAEPEWPPKEGQNIWCISATGEIHQREYDPSSGGSPLWVSLVSCYSREDQAERAVQVLKEARGVE